MLAYLLALAVGFSSFSLYMSAFFFPEVYRKYDLLWSGVGLFYGLVLWVCAGRITGGLLLGQMSSVALLGWLGWQTLSLRFAQTPVEQRTLPSTANSLQEAIQYKVTQIRNSFQDGSWRIYFSAFLDQIPEQAAHLTKTLQGWIEALISTTLKPQEFSSDTPASPASVEKASVEKASVEQQAKTDRPNPEITSSPSAKLLTVQSNPARVFVNPQSLPMPDAKIEFSAEWDELEPEMYPELETMDGASLDQKTHPSERVEPKSNFSDS